MPEDYSWLTRGLEPSVQSEYLAQKRAIAEAEAQQQGLERERTSLLDQLIARGAGNLSPEVQAMIDARIDELDPDELAGIRTEAEQAAYDAAQGYQFGGVAGGKTMDGISIGPPPRRRRPDMMRTGIGMKPATPTIPFPSAQVDGITMGRPTTDTVPAMLTPGEGVLNTGAMSMIGEPAVNALNRAGRGYEQGGKVEEDEKYMNPYPTFEETQNWTAEDWERWRRLHPRFEPTPTPQPEHFGQGGVAGRGGGRGDFSGYDFSDFSGHGAPRGGAPHVGFYGGTMGSPGYWMDPKSERGGPMPATMPLGPWGNNPLREGQTDLALYGGGFSRRKFLDKMFPQRGNPAEANLAEGGVVQGFAEGTPSVEIDTGPYRSTWQQWLDIRNPTDNLGSAGPGSFRGFQHQFQNRPAPPVYVPGMVPGETLGPRDRARISGGSGPGYGWAPTGGPGWSPLPGAGAGSPGMGGSLNPLAGMPSQGYNWKPWLDKMFPGRTQATAGVESGGIVMEDGVVPSFQEGGTVQPIGYVDPREYEWEEIAFTNPNVDVAKLREQAQQSGISPETIKMLAGLFKGSGGGTTGATGYGARGGGFSPMYGG